jgi:NAD(P)-dependent dehydrogenase (short-subunit alcohol dehydrogenase family)
MGDRLTGKRALITGAASGLGLAMAQMFVREGAQVLMTDINGDKVRAEAVALGAQACTHDVTNPDDWVRAVDLAASALGGLSVLVNNAGIALMGSVEDMTLADWHRVHSVDLDSVFLGCKTALPLMAKTTRAENGRGAILNIASIASVIASGNMAAYNSAKAAVGHLTKSVALHCAKAGYPITCNSLHPVFIDTPILDDMIGRGGREDTLVKLGRQIPLGKVGEPDDVAFAAVYLCSDEAKFVTGTGLNIDGGISAV